MNLENLVRRYWYWFFLVPFVPMWFLWHLLVFVGPIWYFWDILVGADDDSIPMRGRQPMRHGRKGGREREEMSRDTLPTTTECK